VAASESSHRAKRLGAFVKAKSSSSRARAAGTRSPGAPRGPRSFGKAAPANRTRPCFLLLWKHPGSATLCCWGARQHRLPSTSSEARQPRRS
jgi:hypothetical protein